MTLPISLGLFVLAGLCEIGGGYLVWLWFREGRSLSYGIAGAATKAAVLAYQRGHPDLVADGVAGPATQASIARDVALRQSVGAVVGAAAGAATVSAAAAVGTGGSPLVVAAIAGVAVLVAFGIFLALRYRDELTRAFRPTQGS